LRTRPIVTPAIVAAAYVVAATLVAVASVPEIAIALLAAPGIPRGVVRGVVVGIFLDGLILVLLNRGGTARTTPEHRILVWFIWFDLIVLRLLSLLLELVRHLIFRLRQS
jgi:hypothetical protein